MFPILKQPRIELEWKGKAENEIGVVKSIDKDKFQAIILLLTPYSLILLLSPSAPTTTAHLPVLWRDRSSPCPYGNLLIGDASKAKDKLDWQAETKLEELVKIMVTSDFKKVLEKGY